MGRKRKASQQAGGYDLSEFIYVDTYAEDPATGNRTQWNRVKVTDVHDFQAQKANFNVFATVNLWRIPAPMEDEVMFMPLYFDLDCDQGIFKLLQAGRITLDQIMPHLPKALAIALDQWKNMDIDPSTEQIFTIRALAGDTFDKRDSDQIESNPKLKALVASTQAVPVLKDLRWYGNLTVSQSDAIKLREFFIRTMGLKAEDVRFWFSGRKGYHVMVSARALGVEPRSDLYMVFKHIALQLRELLGLEALDIGSIYSKRRMLRLVNSIHQKSKLFKVELSPDEVGHPITHHIGIASQPRTPLYPSDSLQVVEGARTWYLHEVQDYEEVARQRSTKVALTTSIADHFRSEGDETVLAADPTEIIESWPVCVADILENSIKKGSDRNKATMALASFLKDMGYSQETAEAVLLDWVMRIPGTLTSSDPTTRKASTRTCVSTVYESDQYHFGCRFMWALNGEREGRKVEKVACAGKTCPCHPEHATNEDGAIPVHLADAANAELTRKQITTKVLVSGKLDTPFIVPKEVRYFCAYETGHETCPKRDMCPVGEAGGILDRTFTAEHPLLIEVTNVNQQMANSIIRNWSGAPNCKTVDVEIVSRQNVEELLVVPMAERVRAVNTGTEEAPKWQELDENQKPYVARKVYTVGQTVEANQYYQLTGYVFPHPKNMMGTVLADLHEPLQDNVAQFKLTPEIQQALSIFQVQKGETLDDRIDVILDDLTENVTFVWERDAALLALLLTYHSVLSFDFQGLRVKRGWLESILVGDSGQAKSQLADNMMEFIGLGEGVSGESASRTGLVYRLEQIGERWFINWGKYPLNDRKLLKIDELAEMSAEDLGRMTESRSTGVLKVDRVINAETNARTRLFLMTNPRDKRPLREFTYGVEALKTVFDAPADIRRLDLAVFMASGDVPQEVLNRKIPPPENRTSLISSETIKNSVLWAWSRRADHVNITEPAVDLILAEAGRLADKYGHAQNIPLCEPADLRIKLARMAVAAAALVHSTDKTHEQVIVTADHVRYVVEFLELIYDAKNCRLDSYSAMAKEESELTEEEAATITKEIQQFDFTAAGGQGKEILRLFRRNDILKASDITDMTGFERQEVTQVIGILSKHQLVRKTRYGLRKLAKFLIYLDKYAPAE
jgi:hypothetical protein